MPQCHTCPHDGKKNAKACLKCRDTAGEAHHSGRCFVSYGATLEDKGGWETKNGAFSRVMSSSGIREVLNLDDCCADAVRRLLGTFAQLSTINRELVFFLLNGGNGALFAERNRLSKQTVYKRLQKIANDHCEFAFSSRSTQECKPKKGVPHGG